MGKEIHKGREIRMDITEERGCGRWQGMPCMQRDGRVATLGEALQRMKYFADVCLIRCKQDGDQRGSDGQVALADGCQYNNPTVV